MDEWLGLGLFVAVVASAVGLVNVVTVAVWWAFHKDLLARDDGYPRDDH